MLATEVLDEELLVGLPHEAADAAEPVAPALDENGEIAVLVLLELCIFVLST